MEISKKRKNESSIGIENSSTPSKKQKVHDCKAVLEYFEFVENRDVGGLKKDFYRCLMCTKELIGNSKGNLKNHLKVQPDIYLKLKEPEQSIEEMRLRLLLNCIEMVRINGRSFSHLYDSALLSMIQPTLDALEKAGRKLQLNSPNLVEIKQYLKARGK